MMRALSCEGWWEQNVYGKQTMHDLRLEFSDGAVTGSGTDIVGPFTLSGSLDKGHVAITKQYVDQHRVSYFGQFDGEGTMQGTWHIGGQSGRWAIRILPNPSAAPKAAGEQIVPQ